MDFGTGFKTMLPQSSIVVAAYAQAVLPYIEKNKQVDTVTGLVVVVVLGFYVQCNS